MFLIETEIVVKKKKDLHKKASNSLDNYEAFH